MTQPLNAVAVVLEKPESLALLRLPLSMPTDEDVVVDVEWSGISTGTERLLWSGRMPAFPGMGYPLVPGYESVGRVVSAGASSGRTRGERVFVPGARCYGDVRGLFGGAASRVVVPGHRTTAFDDALGEAGVLLALTATAYHAISAPGTNLPDLIVGHGVLGRLLARLTVMAGGEPVVWERNPVRASGADGYAVVSPDDDDRHTYRAIYDASGDATLIDTLVTRLAPGGEIVLAGFYETPIQFAFPPAFMREARFRVAAEWKPQDLVDVRAIVESGRLSLDGLITHRDAADRAAGAYRDAFSDAACLKFVLDWRQCS